MDLNVQIYTGGCLATADIDARRIIDKLRLILKRAPIKSGLIGWSAGTDIREIASILIDAGADIYLWLPVFSELVALAEFSPLVGANGARIVGYDRGNGETFCFCCPASQLNAEKTIDIFEKHYDDSIYDGVFLDKIRFPSFAGGLDAVLSCYCDYCASHYDLPDPRCFAGLESINPFGITQYNDLLYRMNDAGSKLFNYKGEAVFNSLEHLCAYFRGRGLKIGLDLFAPFLSGFVGQDYRRLLPLADMVKVMFYDMTNAPAGLPFELDAYAKAFDSSHENALKRKALLTEIAGYNDPGFIGREISGIWKIIQDSGLNTKLYAGVELNYTDVSPITNEYIKKSVSSLKKADGLVMSWDLNVISRSSLEFLLDLRESMTACKPTN